MPLPVTVTGCCEWRLTFTRSQLAALSSRASVPPHSSSFTVSAVLLLSLSHLCIFIFTVIYNYTIMIFQNEWMNESDWFYLFSGNMHIISPSLLDANVISFTNYHNNNNRRVRRRTIWTSTPLCMGRRSCKIAGRKVPYLLHYLPFHVFSTMHITCLIKILLM